MTPPIRPIIGLPLLVLSLFAAACGGSDFEESPLGLTEWDHGWLVTIEPDEQFDVGLANSVLQPDSPWEIVEFDPGVVALEGEEQIPADADVEEGGSGLAHSAFVFSGVDLGETALAFELVVDGEQVDIAEFTVSVVEDACAVDRGAKANRCGEGFRYHPQDLSELSQGTTVTLEPGGSLDVTLTANALFPDNPWKVAELDSTVVSVDGPTSVRPDRDPGDWSAWDADSRHSFLASWTFTIVGGSEGETTVVFEIENDGRPVDRLELTVTVPEG